MGLVGSCPVKSQVMPMGRLGASAAAATTLRVTRRGGRGGAAGGKARGGEAREGGRASEREDRRTEGCAGESSRPPPGTAPGASPPAAPLASPTVASLDAPRLPGGSCWLLWGAAARSASTAKAAPSHPWPSMQNPESKRGEIG